MQNVVIIGGGFAGLHLARKLSGAGYRILVIDRQNYHQFQPLFYQVATARLEPSTISFPFRKIFQRFRDIEFRLAEVVSIEPAAKQIILTDGKINYDKLIIASGCNTNYFGNELIQKNAFSMKSTEEAIRIRNEVLLSFERFVSAGPKEKEGILNIVIIGGGPTGVELAGAFAEMKKNVLPKDYPRVDFSDMNIYLVEGSDHTLNSMSQEARIASRNYLDKMGVKVKTGITVTSYDGKTVSFKNGEQITSRNVIWAAGVKGNIIEGLPSESIVRNRYVVDRHSKISGLENIYAIGDVALMRTPKYQEGHPQLANVAINQGKTLADNLRAEKSRKKLKAYEYRDLGSMATVGRYKAVVDLPFLKFHGIMAWFTWMFLHLMLILSAKNKLMVFIDWTWNFFTNDSSLRLIFRRDPNR